MRMPCFVKSLRSSRLPISLYAFTNGRTPVTKAVVNHGCVMLRITSHNLSPIVAPYTLEIIVSANSFMNSNGIAPLDAFEIALKTAAFSLFLIPVIRSSRKVSRIFLTGVPFRTVELRILFSRKCITGAKCLARGAPQAYEFNNTTILSSGTNTSPLRCISKKYRSLCLMYLGIPFRLCFTLFIVSVSSLRSGAYHFR